MTGSDQFARPDWVQELVSWDRKYTSHEELMRLAFKLALGNVAQGGGPFSAIIADHEGHVIEVGWNNVVRSHDSTAHAEVHCIRRAQKILKSHDLSSTDRGPLNFFVSCSPCIQCFGAIYWSGLKKVIAAASKQDAEKIGFDEGPVSQALWQSAKSAKSIEYIQNFLSGEESRAPFEAYTKASGKIY